MTTADATAPVRESALEHYPISFFAIGMGLFGLTLATHAAESAAGMHAVFSTALMWISAAAFATIAAFYLMKAFRHPAAVAAEWRHPVRIAFFPAISISLLLLATAMLSHDREIARLIWIAAAAAQAVMMLSVVGNWIAHRHYQTAHLTPAWFIPAVGNVVVPVAGAQLGHVEISWLFFSAGLLFWIVLLTLVMNRLIFHDPIPARLLPTLVILVAPPAVAFLAWYRLTGEIDPFARILLNSAYVFLAIVLTQAKSFFRLPFALSRWSLSIHVAAVTLASFLFARVQNSPSASHGCCSWRSRSSLPGWRSARSSGSSAARSAAPNEAGLQAGQPACNPPCIFRKSTTDCVPSPRRRSVKTKGRLPRAFRASCSMPSRSTPTCGARSALLMTSRSERVIAGPPLRGMSPPWQTEIT